MAVSVESQGAHSVTFKHAPAALQRRTRNRRAPRWPLQRPSLPSGAFPIPRAAIKIDGNFEDWSGIAPAFQDPAGDALDSEKNVDIIACFLATDDTYLYVRSDISDDRKSSLFRPHNFKWNTWTTYQLDVFGFDTFIFQLGTHYEEGKHQWVTQANRTELRPRMKIETHRVQLPSQGGFPRIAVSSFVPGTAHQPWSGTTCAGRHRLFARWFMGPRQIVPN